MITSKNQDGNRLTVALDGRIDTLTAPQLESELKPLLNGITELVLDFAQVAYISSAGLRVLLATQKSMRTAGGSLMITNAVPAVREVFDITGFSDILTLA
jgi:anti-sigma B factor antagonist